MKGELRLRILEFIKSSGQVAEDVLFIFSLPYGTSLSRTLYLLDKRQGGRGNFKIKISNQKRKNFRDFLYRLKKDNLIIDIKRNRGRFFKLSQKGREVLERLWSNKLPDYKYRAGEEDTWKIIIFDIPEREKKKRAWLRSALKNLKFRMVQKSVWIGKVGLPKEFIEDINRINILSYVEIFSINKRGSLKQITNNF